MLRVVRHCTTCNRSGPYVKDKFRVDIYAGKKIIGRKLIPSMLVKVKYIRSASFAYMLCMHVVGVVSCGCFLMA